MARKKKKNFNVVCTTNGYDIVLIDSFEKTEPYRLWTSWIFKSDWHLFDLYTNGGVFYFCIQRGFENIEGDKGINTPLDEYGLSMIAVSIWPDGSCNTITSRWGELCGGNDYVMSIDELSKVIGCDFKDVFKPIKRFVKLGDKEYVIGLNNQRRKTLFDENGNDILGENVIKWWKEDYLSERFGSTVLNLINEADCENYLTSYEGELRYLFPEWYEQMYFVYELTCSFGLPIFIVWKNNVGYNYVAVDKSRFGDKSVYLSDEWFICSDKLYQSVFGDRERIVEKLRTTHHN